jgi:ribosomal-protein-alanine N-acetyltransferase
MNKYILVSYCSKKAKGIATEAGKALIKYFFDIGFNRIFAYHNPNNPSSGRAMQKCGMTFEGRIRGGSLFASEICDCLQYSILKSDVI